MPLFVIEIPDDDEAPSLSVPEGAQAMGHAAGVRWYKAAGIPSEGREPTDEELAQALLELPAIRSLKSSVRRRIEREVGDAHELLADQARQIEALTALVARMATDYLGGTAMSEETKTAYLARTESIVAALDDGSLMLRGDLEAPDAMLMRLLGRANRINQIVADDYLPRRSALLEP